jgi:hypothetical protein
MNTNEPTPRPQAAAVPPFDKQRWNTFHRTIYGPSTGDPVIDRLRFQYALMSYFQECDFTFESHVRRRGWLESIVLRAGNAGPVTDIRFVIVPITDGGQL